MNWRNLLQIAGVMIDVSTAKLFPVRKCSSPYWIDICVLSMLTLLL